MGQAAAAAHNTAEPERLPPWLEAIILREFHKNAVDSTTAEQQPPLQLNLAVTSGGPSDPPAETRRLNLAGTSGDPGNPPVETNDVSDGSASLPPSPPPSPGGVPPPPPGTSGLTASDSDESPRLTLEQFVAMDFSSIKDVHIPLFDITTLVLADRDADGLFSLEQDVMGFALHVYRTYARLAKITSGTTATSASSSLSRSERTVKSLVTGELVRELWIRLVDTDADGGASGIQRVTAQICNIVLGNKAPVAFSSQPGVAFVDSDMVHTMYRMLSVARSHRIGFQPFFDLMQQSAEDRGLMDLEEEEFDNVVPLEVVQEFVADWLIGFCNLVPLHREQARGL